jgi:hypothetical protein
LLVYITIQSEIGIKENFMISESMPFSYHYDDRGPYAYVMVNCNAEQLRHIVGELDKARKKTHRFGRSIRVADNGRQYQHFIRISKQPHPTVEKVELFFEQVFGVYSDRHRLAMFKDSWIDLQVENERLKAEMDDVKQDAEESRSLAEVIDEDKQRLLQEKNELQQKISSQQIQLQRLQEQCSQVMEELERAQYSGTSGKRHNFRDDLTIIFSSLLPSIRFLRDSVDTLAELDGYQHILSELYRLSYQLGDVMGERCERAKEWKELRPLSDSRLYYRDRSGKMDVLLSYKHDQERDLKYLRRVK